MVLATEIMMPPRRHSLNGPDPVSKSPPKSHWWFFTSKLKPTTSYGGSTHTVAIQKLRESKWFNQDEERLFCAVIESGFIVEIMQNEQSIAENKSHYGVVSVEAKKSEFCYQTKSLWCFVITCHQIILRGILIIPVYLLKTHKTCAKNISRFFNLSVCLCQSCKFSSRKGKQNNSSRANHFLSSLKYFYSIFGHNIDKKPTATDIFVYTVNKIENRLKVIKLSIAELWQQNYKLRINNINDKAKKANDDKEIKSQVRSY